MKSFIDSVEPAQATPMKVTSPSYFCRASSTEGASALHELQPGAQNHRTVGPVMSGRESTSNTTFSFGADGSTTGDTDGDAGVDAGTEVTTIASTSLEDESFPQATKTIDAIARIITTERRTMSPYPGIRCHRSRTPIPFLG